MNQITNHLKLLFTFSKIELKKIVAYSGQMSSLLITLPIKALLTYLIWSNLATYNETINLQWLIYYYIIVSFIEFITMPYCEITYDLMWDVSSGNLDMYLIRQMHYLRYKFFSKLHLLFLFMFMMVILEIIYNIDILSLQGVGILYFYCISVSYIFIIFALVGLLSFQFENVLTLRDNAWNIIRLLSGSILPLSYYPSGIERVLKFLPFGYIYYKPVIFTQNFLLPTGFDYIISFAWLVIGIIVLEVLWQKSICKYTSQGG